MNAAIAGAAGGILAALITLAGVILSARWRLADENIIKERAKWREAVRSIVAEAVSIDADTKDGTARARRLWGEIALRMNPEPAGGKGDRELVKAIASLIDTSNRNDEVRGRILGLAAPILKHDWERAKWEASGRFWEDEPEQSL
ncbi:hypothetical protein HMP09_2347 [Sphingomonas sp. HMP9]|uniref:hypothetical protein n=1 Tax=Sphingomonas sp. HMP9 TaxID=1517554 RepID=UPI001596FC4E|nr:hypothetical protein [Sphingomonas sp. HMP9]BCA63113.1 hypothetical protein HMP09_2347 [Sphingomonas sp. HMP9]